MRISIDIGNGYVKACNENGDTVHFPTVLKEKKEKSLFNSKAKYQVGINGKEYYIGEIAIAKKGMRSWRNDKEMNENTEKFVALCCHLLTSGNENNVELIIGLPYSYYIEQADNTEIADSLKSKTFETAVDGEIKNSTIQNVTIYPQGVGAYFYNIFDIHGVPREGASELIRSLVIDIGYRTVDTVAFDNLDGEFVLVQENSFSLEDSGIINVVNHIVGVLSAEVQLDANEVERWLRIGNGIVQYGGGEFDVRPFENEANEILANNISTEINTKLQGDIKKYRNIFLTGGGAKMLYPLLKKKYSNLQLQDEYIFCNAKGYLAIEKAG